MDIKEAVQDWLKRLENDPIGKILLKNSNLTEIQVETFLIDVLAENIVEKNLTFEEKANLRLVKSGVSRGAFNRTLNQARRNVIQSVFTILLLGYLGVFESTKLDLYLETANKLQTYISTFRELSKDKVTMNDQLNIMRVFREDLEASLKQIIKFKK